MELAASLLMVLVMINLCSSCTRGERHIFDDLTASELQEVIDYLYDQPDLGLSKAGRGLRTSFIRNIEAANPIKQEALNFCDCHGPRPVKEARAILYRGDLPTPIVQDYVISPIPSPTSHKLYKNSKWRDPIPFTARSPLNVLERPMMEAKMREEIALVDHIIKETTGYSYSNCTNRCLEMVAGGPPHATPGGHKMLAHVVRSVDGRYINPIGLQFVLNMEAMITDLWTVSYVSWQGQEFKNFQEMRSAYEKGELKSRVLPVPDNIDNELSESSLNFRGVPRPEAPQRGRQNYMPEGDRFTEAHRSIKWMGWSFNFNIRTSTGLQVHDIRYQDERIVYELSIQELYVQYSGGDAASRHTIFFDSEDMIGLRGSELFPGIDCPYDARFFDTVHFDGWKPRVFKNRACVFEWNKGIPLRRHYSKDQDHNMNYFQGIPDHVLVLRTIPAVDNYDYMVDVIFHQDGKIEVKTSLTGYISSKFYQGAQSDRYGYEIFPNVYGDLHVHMANFKVDIDIAGTENRFKTLAIKMENITDALNPGKMQLNRRLKEILRRTEKEAAYKFDFDTPGYNVFQNQDSRNRYGNPRGYRVHINDIGKFLTPLDYRGARSYAWAQYQMAVTRYSDQEYISSSGLYNYMEPFDPVISLQDYIDDDENIVDEDLVAWITVTAHHIPHTEDIPIVTSPGLQLTFMLLPFNYFDAEPSLASRDNLRVNPTSGRTRIYKYSGVPSDENCLKKDVTCQGVVDTNSGSQISKYSENLMVFVLLLLIVIRC